MHVQSCLSIFVPYRFSIDRGTLKITITFIPSCLIICLIKLEKKIKKFHSFSLTRVSSFRHFYCRNFSPRQILRLKNLKDPWTRFKDIGKRRRRLCISLNSVRDRTKLVKNDWCIEPVTFSLATNRQLNRSTHFFVSQCSASITVFCTSCYEGVFHLSRSWNRTSGYRFPTWFLRRKIFNFAQILLLISRKIIIGVVRIICCPIISFRSSWRTFNSRRNLSIN